MKRLPLRLLMPAVALFGVFLLTAVYLYQGFLGGSVAQRPTVVTVELARTGGLFEGSSVTYRGVRVGSVDRIETTATGVRVELSILAGQDVPASSRAVVRNLSPAGEQFLDFQPVDTAGPAFADGDLVAVDRTATPVTVAESLQAIDELMTQVDTGDLRLTLDELSVAFADPDALGTVIDSGQEILAVLDERWPEAQNILRQGRTVLQTGEAIGDDLRTFAPAARDLTTFLREYDPTVRAMLASLPGQTEELRAFTSTVGLRLPTMLQEMVAFTDVTRPYEPHLRQTLEDLPGGFGKFASSIVGGRLQTTMYIDTALFSERVCRYVGDTVPTHAERPPIDATRTCPAEFSLQQRGTNSAPGPVAVP